MFIKTVDGNIINTEYIVEIYITDPQFEQTTFNVIATLHGNGSRCIRKCDTRKQAEEELKTWWMK